MESEAEAPKFSSEVLMVLRPAPEKKFYNFGCFCFKSQTFSTFMILNFFWKQKFFFGKGCFADGGNFFFAHLEIFGPEFSFSDSRVSEISNFGIYSS